MVGSLLDRVAGVAGQSDRAQQEAQHAFDGHINRNRNLIASLVGAAKEIQDQKGETLAGHPFRYDGPDRSPTHDPNGDLFVARVFEASFLGATAANSTFSLGVYIDKHQQVTLSYSGAATPLTHGETHEDQFVTWLRDMRMHYPT
jgi:hypothetical protein